MEDIQKYFIKHYHQETFVDMLLRLIDEKRLKDADVYKSACLDRKLFSHIRSDENYHPSKKTVVCLALALHLDNATCKKLVKKAGYILTGSLKFDLAVRYCIENQIYDVLQANEIIYEQSGESLL